MASDLPVQVWTCATGRRETDAAPGLLLAWRQRESVGLEGWRIAADPARFDATEASVRQAFVPASSIRPVDASLIGDG
ncbi:hypothetical protein [Nocardioides sp. AX2bis]|uniref:hypothetical protein n=1 Tax=Nocardioides sp. AX2bis TaxID=2653157 RepID=UPI0012F34B61|nr:hypothetical protein [Nocardioides sp. AX2bis]VXC47833.1 hypothetical protein NOCARDAX2BIS_610005 [Nocardioides sp. AX2bis]